MLVAIPTTVHNSAPLQGVNLLVRCLWMLRAPLTLSGATAFFIKCIWQVLTPILLAPWSLISRIVHLLLGRLIVFSSPGPFLGEFLKARFLGQISLWPLNLIYLKW